MGFILWSVAMVQGGVPGEGLVVEWLNAQKEVRAVEASFSQERKLRTLRRVLKSEGKLWFIAPDRFRWEVGDPAKMVALQSGDGKVTVIEPRKKRAKVYDPANPEHAEMVQRLGLMKPGFGGGAEKFKEQFEVKKVSRAEGSDTWEAEMSFKDSRMALVVMKVVMRVNGKTGVPVEFRLEFRDGTKIGWRFGAVVRDGEIAAEVFDYDLEGYEVEG